MKRRDKIIASVVSIIMCTTLFIFMSWFTKELVFSIIVYVVLLLVMVPFAIVTYPRESNNYGKGLY